MSILFVASDPVVRFKHNLFMIEQKKFRCILESRGRVLDGELLYTKILEVNLFCSVDWREIFMKQSVGKCKQINFLNLCVHERT